MDEELCKKAVYSNEYYDLILDYIGGYWLLQKGTGTGAESAGLSVSDDTALPDTYGYDCVGSQWDDTVAESGSIGFAGTGCVGRVCGYRDQL